MSGVPSGPGWWQASDGRWYPPESHPSYRPAAPASPPVSPPLPGYPPGHPPAGPPGYSPGAQQGHPPASAPPGYPAGYGAWPSNPYLPPSPSRRSGTGWVVAGVAILIVVAVVGLAVVAAGLGGGRRTMSTQGQQEAPSATVPDVIRPGAPDATRTVSIIGGPGGELGALLAATIADVEAFWTEEMPTVYGQPYQPVAGGFFSVSPNDPSPPCIESRDQIEGNAFYCSTEDVVAWDDTGLIPELLSRHGELSVAIVFAHEFGHAIQARVNMQGATVTLEHQADCFAGAWVDRVRAGDSEYFQLEPDALDRALVGFLEIADTPGTPAEDPNAHGSAFDRINAFQDGLEDGAAVCAKYRNSNIDLVEIPWLSVEDAARGGDLPLNEIVPLATTDLEDYWSTIAEQEFSTDWQPLEAPRGFNPSRGIDCGGDPVEDLRLFYCVPDRYIGYDSAEFMPSVYEGGDFAVATLLATQFALAAQEQLGLTPDGALAQNVMADCMTGAWTASVFNGDRPKKTNLALSPGDLDEAIGVLLAFGDGEGESGQASGFDRVSSYRKGVLGGIRACTDS